MNRQEKKIRDQVIEVLEAHKDELMDTKRNSIAEKLEKLSVLAENRYADFFDLTILDLALSTEIKRISEAIGQTQRAEEAEKLRKAYKQVGELSYDEVSNYGAW